jgi:hypothetical protein
LEDIGGAYPQYSQAARQAGYRFGPRTPLAPHILSETTPITEDEDPPLDGVPVALSAATPTAILRFYFQDPAFIRRATSTVIGMRLTAAGQPDQLFQNSIDPRDYVYAQLRRDGSGDVFQTDLMPLSEMTGTGAHSYFWNLVPVMRRGGSLLLTLSLNPPVNPPLAAPPFVDHVGQVVVSLHTERFTVAGI